MNEQDSEKWLDELLSRTINTRRPEFDPETWKQKYSSELEMLRSQRVKVGPLRGLARLTMILRNPVSRFAAAAIVIAAVFIFARKPQRPEPALVRRQTVSPVEMATAMSLERAYRRGGMEAVEDQCRKVFGTTAGESKSRSILQLLGEQNVGVKIFGGKNL
ncbi:MAG: hypothetical protein ACYSWO_18380 [Planctomycetota bacterium]|jgi:hypothetical protein